MHNSLKLKMKDSLAHIDNDCCHVNGSFRSFSSMVINPEVIDTEVHKIFFSAKYIYSLVQNALHLVLIVFFIYFCAFVTHVSLFAH